MQLDLGMISLDNSSTVPLLRPLNMYLLVRRLRNGISDSRRGYVWKCLAKVHKRKQEQGSLYSELLHRAVYSHHNKDNNDNNYSNNQTQEERESIPTVTSAPQAERQHKKHNETQFQYVQDTIERDICRTFPRHRFFCDKVLNDDDDDDDDEDKPWTPEQIMTVQSGTAALRRVLKAYSVYDKAVGYCQGMNFVTAMLLTVVENEEDAFWLLVAVMNDEPCRMRNLFVEGISGTHKVLYVAEKLMQQFLPRLAHHLDHQKVRVNMFATGWLLTQYTSSFSSIFVSRVWDCYLAEGWKTTYRVMLALLRTSEQRLLTMSFEEILTFFRELPRITDADAIVAQAMDIPLQWKHIHKYEQEWQEEQQQQQRQQREQSTDNEDKYDSQEYH